MPNLSLPPSLSLLVTMSWFSMEKQTVLVYSSAPGLSVQATGGEDMRGGCL